MNSVEVDAVNACNETYSKILEEVKFTSFDGRDKMLMINVKLRAKLEELYKDLFYHQRKFKNESRGVMGRKRNEDILWDVMKGKKHKDVARNYGISIAMVNKIIKQMIVEICGEVDPKLTPASLIKNNRETLVKYFIIKRNKRG